MTRPAARRKSPSAKAAAARKAAITARSSTKRPQAKTAPADEQYPIGKGRKALKGISIYMHPLAKDVLDGIAREQGRTVQDLGLEALNLLFQRYGEKPIA
ncbi:MAG: ribbon-helix-helix domain-containing protein [Hyphomicrobiaceae bacterium]